MGDGLNEVFAVLRVLAEKAWFGVQRIFNWLCPMVGEPAAYAITAFTVILVPFLVLNILFSRGQAVLEKGQAGISALALKGIAVALTTFALLYILGS